jgi:hypothetical protein
MAEQNKNYVGQLAPGEEAVGQPIDEPYQGFAPFMHQGYSMNAAFQEGAQAGRY